MKPTVHLFFNGRGVYIPPGAAWEKFRGLDELRVFTICAESWRRNGWEVKQLSTAGGEFPHTNFLKDGECQKSFGWYPYLFWQFLAKLKQIAEPGELTWFATIDVINFCFRPPLADRRPPTVGYLNLQQEHFSLAAGAATLEWIEEAERILLAYDRGALPALNREYTSDETILRQYAKWDQLQNVLIMASNTQAAAYRMLHFARSTMRPLWDAIPQARRPAEGPIVSFPLPAGRVV